MESARRLERYTARDFLQLDLPDDGWRYELIDGIVVAMNPPGSPHQVLAGRLSGHLFAAQQVTLPGCDLRAQAGIAPDGLDDEQLYEADLALTCTPYEPGDQGVVRDPVLIVEILSPSTDAKDLNRKLPRYKRIASVAEILYVHTEKPEVLIYRRRGRSWETVTLGLGEIITLATVGLSLPVAELYRGIRFASPQAALFCQNLFVCARTNAATRKLLGDLAMVESGHLRLSSRLGDKHLPGPVRAEEDARSHRQFILTWVQPGLAGLMDGSVSTLAPIFATAFATHNTGTTFLVGLAASLGAGISMGFTEAASDDGEISGRGSPLKRGIASGVMTALGGLGHALPYLIPHFWTATAIAFAIVFFELWAIAWIQNKYMETPFWRASFQVVLGGALVFATGILIGSA